jgi:SAM-dependent methyltransferase
VAHYTGVDIRDAALERASKLLQPAGNCTLYRGSGRDLRDIPDRSQQLIFSYQTFVHMPDRDVIMGNLKEVVRVLADGGQARIQLLGPAFGQGLRVVWRKLGSLDARNRRGLSRLLVQVLGKLFPGDLLLPTLRFGKYGTHWGEFGTPIHPQDALAAMRSCGVEAWISPSSYGSRYHGYDFALYWLIIRRGSSDLPFFLTID